MTGLKFTIDSLSERHPGLTKPLGDGYKEAAEVCFDRHHQSPSLIIIDDTDRRSEFLFEWKAPGLREKKAWANEDDATRDGAYGVALAAVEAERGLVAVMRAETRTGADYYIAPINDEFDGIENCLRLEVSGTASGDMPTIRRRLKIKIGQADKGQSDLPAIAAVVGFKEMYVVISDVEKK